MCKKSDANKWFRFILNTFQAYFFADVLNGAWNTSAVKAYFFKMIYISEWLSRHRRTYIYIYIVACKYAYILTYLPTCINAYIHTSVQSNKHTYMPIYLLTYLLPYLLTYLLTFLLTYIHTYVQTYIHSCKHACMHSLIFPIQMINESTFGILLYCLLVFVGSVPVWVDSLRKPVFGRMDALE